MFEHALCSYYRRPLWLGTRPSVVDRLGSIFFSNKNDPRGPLCSIEHDLVTILLLRSCPRTGFCPFPSHARTHAHTAHYAKGGLQWRVTGSTPPTIGDTTRPQVLRTPPEGTACSHVALNNMTTSHGPHRGTTSYSLGTAAYRAMSSPGVIDTDPATRPFLYGMNAQWDVKSPHLIITRPAPPMSRRGGGVPQPQAVLVPGAQRTLSRRSSDPPPPASPGPLLLALGVYWVHE